MEEAEDKGMRKEAATTKDGFGIMGWFNQGGDKKSKKTSGPNEKWKHRKDIRVFQNI